MNPLRPRGQTLVIFALTLLLLTLMVCMTLSIGTKAKEKMELETAADAAAYSQAVATARTYNSISLLNRALMSNMVAMAGVQSLISWAGYYRAVLNEARDSYDTPKTQYELIMAAACACPGPTCNPPMCRCATQAVQDITDTQDKLKQEDDRVDQVFQSLDGQAGLEARALQISSVSDRQNELFDRLLDENLTGSLNIGASIAQELNKGNKWGAQEVKALPASDDVNKVEQDAGQCQQKEGAACRRRDAGHKNHFIWAAMGTRGHAFVTGRSGGANAIRTRLITIITPPDLVTISNDGSGYFADNDGPSHSSEGPTGNKHAWGDDHGNLTTTFLRNQAPCPPGIPGSGSPRAHVRSNDTSGSAGDDEHRWSGQSGGDGGRERQHTMGDCNNCPGMWPPHMDYNWQQVTDNANNFGQPKTYSVMERDLSQRPAKQADPWNLLFTFHFKQSGSGTVFDNTGLKLVSQGGTDISHATALSAGIAYYHRVQQGSYQEPPNFLNPFWRATLVGADVDLQPGDVSDITQTLGAANLQEAQRVVEALNNAGYRAW
ncbi:pilus assembly protein TadG-related protein [Hyalangium rubrum]|uniref:Pilus assembly protein TadG-related protein n=1 Tax=Hyalangium rubrum TaxID=3103134 RepID=A0ABU5GYC4_9BACT|nr:pilus assembly protein TadG-related protein [Hyalangium sp. s54d21]MDY7226188.1 pilus assembly protein TadG-related protein [Hyalangium sp. s54d21]